MFHVKHGKVGVEMKRTKVEKHLARARKHLEYLRESYVETMRNPNWRCLENCSVCGGNPYKEKLQTIREEMEETKTRIAKFERILL